jgi:glycosyltransferase involved in cell wall biosynthesis
MNVLLVNQSDISGGAAIAGYRLHQGLGGQGIHSRLLVGSRLTGDEQVVTVARMPRIENRLLPLTRRLGLNYLHLVATFLIPRHPVFKEADLLHFHNLHMEYFNYLALPTLTQDKPALFTLHDMWSFTGHCSYSYECGRWRGGCGKCPHPEVYPSIERDNTHLEWKLKRWAYSRSNLTIVTPSRWLSGLARESILNRFPIHHIFNGLDMEAYRPIDRETCKFVLGIPTDKRVIMFGAPSLSDYRKGGDLLVKALLNLPASLKNELVLLTMGEGGETFAKAVAMNALHLGYVSSDHLKSIAFSAADLFLFPTRADNSPVVLQESMACGTPMVSFDVGGVPELVLPAVTGYLAKPEDDRDFSKGILNLLEDETLRHEMGRRCREIALQEFSLGLQARKYIELYRQALDKTSQA